MGAKQGEVTIKDIAASLGIAHSTVSRALNDHPHTSKATKARVRRAAEELGYIANSGARAMRSRTSRLVGLIVPDVQNDFYSAAARVMAEFCDREGYQLTLSVSEDDPSHEQHQVQALREARVAGVVIAATARPRRDTVQMLDQLSTVQFLRRHPAIGGHAVSADDMLGLKMATEHLIHLGHRRIGYIGVPEQLSTGRGRAEGFRTAMAAAGLEIDPDLVREETPRPEFGREAAEAILTAVQPPTAVVVASSRLTLGVLEAVRRHRVSLPRDLSLINYGDHEWFRVYQPSISAIGLPVADMAATAAAMLFQQMRHRLSTSGLGAHAPFEPILHARDSSAPLPIDIRSGIWE